MPRVCVDASLVLNLLLPDEPDQRLADLWSEWIESQTIPFGPPLIYAEVPSALRRSVHSGDLCTPAESPPKRANRRLTILADLA